MFTNPFCFEREGRRRSGEKKRGGGSAEAPPLKDTHSAKSSDEENSPVRRKPSRRSSDISADGSKTAPQRESCRYFVCLSSETASFDVAQERKRYSDRVTTSLFCCGRERYGRDARNSAETVPISQRFEEEKAVGGSSEA